MSKKEAVTFGIVVTSALFLNLMPFYVLFDLGATHSFISIWFALQLDLQHTKIEATCRIKLPNDSIVDCLILYKYVLIFLGEFIFPGDLIQCDLSDFDIILGMNFLCAYEAKIDCKDLKGILTDEKGREVCFYRQRVEKPFSIISSMKVSKLLCQGCEGYWCYTMDIQQKEGTTDNVLLVYEFKDVFPEELLGLPPEKEINFEIELIPRSQPISKAPYRMAPIELKELKS